MDPFDLRPGSLVGLPHGVPHPSTDLALLQYGLVGLAWSWAALALLERGRAALLAGSVFAATAVGFWTLALARPYGLLIDAEATRRAAETAVVAATADASQGALAKQAPASRFWPALAGLGLPPRLLVLLPTLLPLIALLALALLLAGLGARSESAENRGGAWLSAWLWLAFPMSDLEAARGEGFVAGAWRRPEAVLALVPLVTALLALGRARARRGLALGIGLGLVAAWGALAPRAGNPRGLVAAALALTLDQGLLFLLGAWGVARGPELGAGVFLLGGAALTVAAHAGFGTADPWGGQSIYRIGLLLAACGPLRDGMTWAGRRLRQFPRLRGFSAPALGRAAFLLVAVPSSALVWWDPRLDAVLAESLKPPPQSLLQTTEWIRRETEAKAVFLASPSSAPAVAALGGRRVLRAPSLARAADDELRQRVQWATLQGLPDRGLLASYGIRYVLTDGGEPGRAAGDVLEARGLRPIFTGQDGLRVFAVGTLAPGHSR